MDGNRLSNYEMSNLIFFFQAEDGIRDKLVTGVQTCALPIFQMESRRHRNDHGVNMRVIDGSFVIGIAAGAAKASCIGLRLAAIAAGVREIGRASCRERVGMYGAARGSG